MAQNKNKKTTHSKEVEAAQVYLHWIKFFMLKSYFPHMTATTS